MFTYFYVGHFLKKQRKYKIYNTEYKYISQVIF